MAMSRSRSPCPGVAKPAQAVCHGQVSTSWCLAPLFPFLVGRRTEHGLSMGHRVTLNQQEQHSLAQIPHSQPHARAASPGLPVPALQNVGTARATPFLPPLSFPQSRDDHPLPVPPCQLWRRRTASPRPGQPRRDKIPAPRGCRAPAAGPGERGVGLSPGPCVPALGSRCAHTLLGVPVARQVRTGRQRRADCERSGAERGGGPGWGQGGPRRLRCRRGERGKGPRGRHASQRKGVCRQSTSRQTETPGRAPGRWRQSFVHRRAFEQGAVGAPRTKGDFSLPGRGSPNRDIPGRHGWPG